MGQNKETGTKKPEEKNMSTKVFFYTLRPFDEQAIVKDLAQRWGVEYGYTEAYPTLENAQLAAGYDAVSLTPCDMSAPMVQRFHDLGVKAICCRSIGYDHVDLEKARELGMKVSNVDYPPSNPPVQDATPNSTVAALPKTGVNWFTALAMALSGMALTVAGAFTSLFAKSKH